MNTPLLYVLRRVFLVNKNSRSSFLISRKSYPPDYVKLSRESNYSIPSDDSRAVLGGSLVRYLRSLVRRGMRLTRINGMIYVDNSNLETKYKTIKAGTRATSHSRRVCHYYQGQKQCATSLESLCPADCKGLVSGDTSCYVVVITQRSARMGLKILTLTLIDAMAYTYRCLCVPPSQLIALRL